MVLLPTFHSITVTCGAASSFKASNDFQLFFLEKSREYPLITMATIAIESMYSPKNAETIVAQTKRVP